MVKVAQQLSSCIRPTFQAPPGRTFVCVDYSAIEARVLAWLTDDPNLETFRQGKDIYIEMASKIYQREVTKADEMERKLGKEAELACGYQLWWKTLLTRCWKKGVKVDPPLALQTVKLYREEHPKVKAFWYDVERAFMECILYGKPTEISKLRFKMFGTTLRMIFPSGRYIVYNNPSVKRKTRRTQSTKKLKSQLKQLGAPKETIDEACEMHNKEAENTKETARRVACYYREQQGKWVETSTYGGKITENASQGVAGDLLSSASLRLDKDRERFGDAVLTVHDELVMEQNEDKADLKGMIETMCFLPWWAEGLPLAGEGWVGKDYRK